MFSSVDSMFQVTPRSCFAIDGGGWNLYVLNGCSIKKSNVRSMMVASDISCLRTEHIEFKF